MGRTTAKTTKANMARPLALFTADNHLDIGAWVHRPKLRWDSRLAFEETCSIAIKKEVEAVFVAGDFWDARKPPSEVIDFVRGQLDRLEQADIAFYFIQGQHGLASPPWLSAVHGWPRWLHRSSTLLGSSINIYGIDWTPPERIGSQLKDVPPGTDILVMHQVWSDFMGDIAICECGFEDVPVATTLFTGDYHKAVYHGPDAGFKGASGQPLEIISPGSTNRRSIDEPQVKRVRLYSDDGSWSSVALRSRPFIAMDIANKGDLTKMAKKWSGFVAAVKERSTKIKLHQELQLPIVWVRCLETLEGAMSRVEEIVGDDAEIFFKRVPSADNVEGERRAARREILDRGLLGCLELAVPRDDKRYVPLARLLNSLDADEELVLMRDERLNGKEKKVKKKKAKTDDHPRQSGKDKGESEVRVRRRRVKRKKS